METGEKPDALSAYNDPSRARRYHQSRGFDPPRKRRMLEVVTRSLLDLTAAGAHLLELGAGSGDLTRRLAETGHFRHIMTTDGAAAMQAIAREELGHLPGLEFSLLSFTQPGWGRQFPQGFGAVASSMALHHAEDKAAVFREIYRALRPGGVLVFSDHMSGASAEAQGLVDRERARVRLGPEAGPGDVRAFIARDMESQAAEGNRCESVSAYLDYLRSAGFAHPDCVWRDYWVAVFVAQK